MSFSSPPRAQIVLKQEGKDISLKAVHIVSGSAYDTRYYCQCPVWSKFEETSYDVVQSLSYDAKEKNFVYSIEKKAKKKNDSSSTSDQPGFLLKVSNANKDWSPMRIRVDPKEMEGEVIFCRALISLDGNMKFIYSVVLFMDAESKTLRRRVNVQRDIYANSSWVGIDMMHLMERRMRLEEMCRKMKALGYGYCNNDESSNDSSLEMPEM